MSACLYIFIEKGEFCYPCDFFHKCNTERYFLFERYLTLHMLAQFHDKDGSVKNVFF